MMRMLKIPKSSEFGNASVLLRIVEKIEMLILTDPQIKNILNNFQ